MANCLGNGNGGSNVTDPSFNTPNGIVQTTASASNVIPDCNVTCTLLLISFDIDGLDVLVLTFVVVSWRDRFLDEAVVECKSPLLFVFVGVPPMIPLLDRFDRRTSVTSSPRIRRDWRCGSFAITIGDDIDFDGNKKGLDFVFFCLFLVCSMGA